MKNLKDKNEKAFAIHNVSKCTSCGIEINYKGLCDVCYCRGNDAYESN